MRRKFRRNVRGGLLTPVTPKTIFGSSLELWLRADLGITLNGGNVSAWADQSGKGDANRNATQGTAINQPPFNASDSVLRGQPSVGPCTGGTLFLASGNWAAPVVKPWTVWTVGHASQADGVNNRYFLGTGAAGTTRHEFYQEAGGGNVRFISGPSGTPDDLTSGVTSTPDVPVVLRGEKDTGNVRVAVNAVTPQASAASAQAANFGTIGYQIGETQSIGAATANRGTAEVILISRMPTAGELASLHAYFTGRYGIAFGA